MKRVREAFEAFGLRTRFAAVALAALVAFVAYVGLVNTLDSARSRLQTNVTALRAASQQLDRHAVDIERLRAAPKPATSPRELRAVIEAEAKAAGVSHALRVDTSAADEVRVIVSRVAFADWLAWLERLQSANVRVKSARVEALSADGAVTGTTTFARTP